MHEVEGNELRDLLVRSLVQLDESAGGGVAYVPVAQALAQAYTAWLAASEREEAEVMDGEPSDYTQDRTPLLSREAAEREYRFEWLVRYSDHLGLGWEDAYADEFLGPRATLDAAFSMALPAAVIRDVARARADKDAEKATNGKA